MRGSISWQDEKAVIANAVSGQSATGGRLLSNRSGTILIAGASHESFAGTVDSGPYCRIAMVLSGGGRLRQRGEDISLDEDWRPGAISLLLPRRTYCYKAPATRFLGLAVDFERHLGPDACPLNARRLETAAGLLHRDDLISSVLKALSAEAEIHGASSAFFEHGVDLIFTRLAALGGGPVQGPSPGLLSPAQLSRIEAFIDHHLADDLTVTDLARELGRDRTGFARAFRLSTGRTPYAYLTQRRMRKAMELLSRGETVTAVAAAVGYANPSKFAAAFRRIVAMSPQQWVKR